MLPHLIFSPSDTTYPSVCRGPSLQIASAPSPAPTGRSNSPPPLSSSKFGWCLICLARQEFDGDQRELQPLAFQKLKSWEIRDALAVQGGARRLAPALRQQAVDTTSFVIGLRSRRTLPQLESICVLSLAFFLCFSLLLSRLFLCHSSFFFSLFPLYFLSFIVFRCVSSPPNTSCVQPPIFSHRPTAMVDFLTSIHPPFYTIAVWFCHSHNTLFLVFVHPPCPFIKCSSLKTLKQCSTPVTLVVIIIIGLYYNLRALSFSLYRQLQLIQNVPLHMLKRLKK